MGRKAITEERYLKTAKKRNFTVLRIPKSCREPTEWRCNNCNRVHRISQNSLEYSKTYGCHCNISLSITEYQVFKPLFILAETELPLSTKEKVKWIHNDKIIYASYYEVKRKCQRLQKLVK